MRMPSIRLRQPNGLTRYMRGLRALFCVAALSSCSLLPTETSQREIALEPDDWQQKDFSGRGEYVLTPMDGRQVLCGHSQSSASALTREIAVDLTQTPVLSWRWRVVSPVRPQDERSQLGDDFSARVYVVHAPPGRSRLATRAINYVWAAQATNGESWPNPYGMGRSTMISLRNAEDGVGVWQAETRNVREDFRRYAGVEIETVHVLALMTDSDNTGQQSAACYADIWFRGE